MKRILVVGSGGREHALCWALRRENPLLDLWCAPGNPGTETLATNIPVSVSDIAGLVDQANRLNIDLTIVGPEAPLAAGLVDQLQAAGGRVFGPTASAARIEASKAFAKEVMEAAGVPTAASATFTDLAAAVKYIQSHAEPLVVKASGLAAGKGAVVCPGREEAILAVRAMMGDGIYGDAGRTVVVEAFLEGEELSVFAITNGRDIRLLPAAQDHKRLLDGDVGPNTGGMGAYAPVSFATPELLDRVRRDVLVPTLAEMERRGSTFRGVLYAGLMIHPDGTPNVVEFNCRLGDPETQVVLPLVTGGLTELLWRAAGGDPLSDIALAGGAAVTTVLAAGGYPDRPEKGAPIDLPDTLPDGVLVFHAGTQMTDGQLVVNGGRVFAVTGIGDTFQEAQTRSRAGTGQILFRGRQFRNDIGWREAARV